MKNSEEWKLIKQISPKSRESYSFAGFSVENPNEIYVNANLGNDKTGIYLYNIKTGTYSERLFGLENVDADGVIFDRNGKKLGFSYTNKHPERYFVDDKEQALYDALAPLFKDKFVSIISRSNDDNVLVVRTTSAKDSGSFYVITDKKSLEKLVRDYHSCKKIYFRVLSMFHIPLEMAERLMHMSLCQKEKRHFQLSYYLMADHGFVTPFCLMNGLNF